MAGGFPQGEIFGDMVPFCEPYWYQGFPSAYYKPEHIEFRAKCRTFVETHLIPNADAWIASPDGYPRSLHAKLYDAGITGLLWPKEFGGSGSEPRDYFLELILWDEFARVCGGSILGQLGINSMALPLVLQAGTAHAKQLCARDVITGKKDICLAISEPYAGSDVAGIRTTAVRDGDVWVLNGVKKWITGGMWGDFFVVAARSGAAGQGGLSLFLVERAFAGVNVRKMPTQFDTAMSTTMVTLEDVRVPAATHVVGPIGGGFKLVMANFNHERFVIAAGACRQARMCYSAAIHYAMERKTFGVRLCEHQVIRAKLAEMARQVEALYDSLERVAFSFSNGVPDRALGAQCSLLKVNASRCFEFCAREASQIFGGAAVVREGRGKIVERMYREVRAAAIPGGSEEILLDLAARMAIAVGDRLRSAGDAAPEIASKM